MGQQSNKVIKRRRRRNYLKRRGEKLKAEIALGGQSKPAKKAAKKKTVAKKVAAKRVDAPVVEVPEAAEVPVEPSSSADAPEAKVDAGE